jgi:hypothetical protein
MTTAIAIVKPYNNKGQLALIIENLCIDELYIKKQVYELIFHDVDVFFVGQNQDYRNQYKLKPKRLSTKNGEIKLNDLVIPIQIDYSLL